MIFPQCIGETEFIRLQSNRINSVSFWLKPFFYKFNYGIIEIP